MNENMPPPAGGAVVVFAGTTGAGAGAAVFSGVFDTKVAGLLIFVGGLMNETLGVNFSGAFAVTAGVVTAGAASLAAGAGELLVATSTGLAATLVDAAGAELEPKKEKKPPAGADSSFLAGTGVAAGSTFFDGSGAFAAGFGGCVVGFTGVAGAGVESKNEKKPPTGADSSFLTGTGVATGFTGVIEADLTGLAGANFTGVTDFTGVTGADFTGAAAEATDFTGVAGAGVESKNEKKPPAGADSSFLVGAGVAAGFTGGSIFFGGSGAFAAGFGNDLTGSGACIRGLGAGGGGGTTLIGAGAATLAATLIGVGAA